MLEDLETRENKEGSRNRMKFSLIKTTKVDSAIKFENVTEVKKFQKTLNISTLAQAKISLK